jgi:hypothetical protein
MPTREFVHKQNKLIKELIFYSFTICIDILIVGNMLNLAICLRRNLRREMLGFYNIFLSIFNMLTLITGFIQLFPHSINAQDIMLVSDYTCVCLAYFGRVIIQMTAWLYVFVSVDRYLCVAFNDKFKHLLGTKKTCFPSSSRRFRVYIHY